MKGGAHASHLSSGHGQQKSKEGAEGFQQDWGSGRDRQCQNLGMTDGFLRWGQGTLWLGEWVQGSTAAPLSSAPSLFSRSLRGVHSLSSGVRCQPGTGLESHLLGASLGAS